MIGFSNLYSDVFERSLCGTLRRPQRPPLRGLQSMVGVAIIGIK